MPEFIFTDQNFKDEVLNYKGVVLVDFGAEYCPGCKIITPIMENLTKEYQNKIKIGKMDIAENPKTTAEYGVMSIPVLIIFKEGKIVKQMMGVRPKLKIKEMIDAVLSK
ncbi:MAG: thioredoxin 1 [Parcubacteria group bacterium Athens1014_10]|nr:MAG: thioredoxin 1 [Parcubacteria group bacterium Athens1014_10]TSD05435.1 MAG: thioredoxin 1 [Parcubacteria group bacterium Athens0714_12]